MKTFLNLLSWTIMAPVIVLLMSGSTALADGTETLGPLKGVTIASGTGIIVAGVGLAEPAGEKIIVIEIPGDATVRQAFVYWEGQTPFDGSVDVDFKINGTDINAADPGDDSDGGNRIGKPIFFYAFIPPGEDESQDIYALAYRYDITSLNLVVPGPNSLRITELDGFGHVTDGAGVLVIYEVPSEAASEIDVRDGIDLAFINFAGPRQVTVPQTFTFSAADMLRKATLSMFFSSVQGPVSMGGTPRATSIEVTINDITTIYSNILGSSDGPEWDSKNLEIDIPAGATSLTVQAFSRDDGASTQVSIQSHRLDGLRYHGLMSDDLPASLFWLAGGLSIPPEPPSGDEGCTPGYWKQEHHYGNWADGYTPETPFSDVFEDAFPGMTLVEVLRQGGGGLKALGRHLVAGLLNAGSGNVGYEMTESYVIERFNEVYPGSKHDYNPLKDMLESYNERHCPLGRAERDMPSAWPVGLKTGGTEAALLQNFPNPFNPETRVAFDLPEPSFVSVKIYNTLGEEVRTLAEGQFHAGVHSVVWDAEDNNGNPVPSGTYIYRLNAGSLTQVKKMSLLR